MDKIKECEDKTFELDVTFHVDFGGHVNQFKTIKCEIKARLDI